MIGEELVPLRKVGYLSPLAVIDNGPYEFYRLAPERVMLVMIPVGLTEFSAQDVERVFTPLEELTARLVERGVDIVVQGGVPLPLLIGREGLARVLERIERAAGVPATSTVLCVVQAGSALGIKRIAVANKWSEGMNRTLAEFFQAEGISVVGATTRAMAPAEFQRMASGDSLMLAYQLGRAALEANPSAEALYIGGGAWLTIPVISRLEAEFGKPVITNQTAVTWSVCHQLGCWKPKPEYGILMGLP